MTFVEPSRRQRRAVRPRRGRLARVGLVLLAAAFLFGVGVALGEALHDNPTPGKRRTYTATIVVTATAPVVSK